MQKLQIIGNLGSDVQTKTFSDGKTVLNFSAAVSNGKTKDGTERPASWYNCQLWREKEENTSIKDYLKKGTKVFIEGTPKAEAYLDSAGKAAGSIVIVVNYLELLSATEKAQ